MASPVALITLISLVLFAGVTEARKDPGEYWQGGGVAARNDQALVEALEHIVHLDSDSTLSNKKQKITTASDCHTFSKKDSVAATNKKFVTDLEPRPNLSAYGDDAKLRKENIFIKDFEPRPNLSAYGDNAKLMKKNTFIKDFEPRPNLSAYGVEMMPN